MNQAQKSPAAATVRAAQASTNQQAKYTALALTGDNDKPRVDSRVMADYLQRRHRSVFRIIERYSDQMREHGTLRFEIALTSAKGTPQKYALLNEDQAYFLLTLMRNSDHVVGLKSRLVKAFSDARKAAEHRQTQYLPTYHDMHDRAAEIGGSHIHMNLNRLINKAVKVESGQRRALPVPDQSLIVVYQTIALQAMQEAVDEREAYARAKAAIQTAHRALQGTYKGLSA